MHPALNQGTNEKQVKDQVEEQREENAEMPQPPLDADACVICAESFDRYANRRVIENVTGITNGTSHDHCWFRWLIEDPQGQRHLKVIQRKQCPKPDEGTAWEDYHADAFYEDFITRGLIPTNGNKVVKV